MPGTKGSGGPVPKRSNQRHGHRSAADAEAVTTAPGATMVEVPDPDPDWHPVATLWFNSLASSGQSVFYEPSDWGTAYVLAESISRELSPQPMMIGVGDDAHFEMVTLPPKGAALSAWLKGMTALLVTEGDRRRARVELERPQPAADGETPVALLSEYRDRAG